jgi:hypothetical protein
LVLNGTLLCSVFLWIFVKDSSLPQLFLIFLQKLSSHF